MLNKNHKLYVCERHFNPSEMQKGAMKCILRKNAVPVLGYDSSLRLSLNITFFKAFTRILAYF